MSCAQRIGCTLVLMATASAHAGFQSSSYQTIQGVAQPYAIAIGDFSGDGCADLAVASWHRLPGNAERYDHKKSRVLVFSARDGAFAAKPDQSLIIDSAYSMLADDFDGDGVCDLAAAGRKTLTVCTGGAKGLTALPVHHDSNQSRHPVVAGHIGRNKRMTFLVGAAAHRWLDDRRMAAGYAYSGPARQNDNRAAHIADFNADGVADVAFAGADSAIRIYYGPLLSWPVSPQDASQFIRIKTPAPCSYLVSADCNNDGRRDLIATARERTFVFLQGAPLGFDADAPPNMTLEGVSGRPMIADFSGDGRDDLAVGDGRAIRIFHQKPGSAFAGEPDALLTVPNYAFAVGDLNGDGRPDIAATEARRGAVHLMFNAGKPIETKKQPTPAPAAAPAAPPKRAIDAYVAARPVDLIKAMYDKSPIDDDPMLMPFYTGTIQPTPQQVTYHDRYLPLANAALILGRDIKPDDTRVEVLTDRITRYGGKLTIVDKPQPAHDTVIVLEGTAVHPPPDHEQGYVIHTTKRNGRDIIALRGRDTLGSLWAVSSLCQLVHQRDGKTVVRAADVSDYPTIPNRGYLGSQWWQAAQFNPWPWPGATCETMDAGMHHTIMFKINKPVYRGLLRPNRDLKTNWRKPRPEAVRQVLKTVGDKLTPMGIEWYAGLRYLTYKPEADQLRAGSDEDFQAIYEQGRMVAAAGGHFSIKFDDIRFPMHPDDVRDFGTAREADIHLLLRVHKALKKDFPDVKMLFCPPFYWGPTSNHTYPESRDEYLYALGKRLPADIGIFWTGHSVKSAVLTPEHTDWITERIKRKPYLWQNGMGTPHMYGYQYVTDPLTAWPKWWDRRALEAIDTVMLNAGGPSYAVAVATLSDFLWNPDAYDADRSVRQAVAKLAGPESWDLLDKLNEHMSHFDPYGLRTSPGAAKHLAELEKHEAAVVATLGELIKTRRPNALMQWTGAVGHAYNMMRYYRRIKKNPDLAAYADDAEASRRVAAGEIKLNDDIDQFLSAHDFVGGANATYYANQCERRLATWIYGSKSGAATLRARFEIDPFPPAGDYQLIVSAQDDETEKACAIAVKVNDTVIFEGPNPFVRRGWSRHTFRIPAAALQRYNTLTFHNTEPTSRRGGPPFFMLNYAVVRKGLKKLTARK